jgi:hypothetical protein
MGQYAVGILGDEKKHKAMAQNARKQAERFDLKKIVECYERYYEEIAAELTD